jgi:hypothetical protein
MTYSIEKQELSPQPVLVVRRRVKRSEIAATIGEALPPVRSATAPWRSRLGIGRSLQVIQAEPRPQGAVC